MKNEAALNKLLDFILETSWEHLSASVHEQAQKCFLDLVGVFTAGAKNNTSKTIAGFVRDNYPSGDCTIFATGEKTNLIGAAMANGMAANALDMDDGFSLLRGHPGAGFFGALLSAAELTDCTYGEFLTALVISYEVSIRQGFSIRDYYKWDHSTGCYSAFGAAAGVGRLLRLDRKQMEMALSIADFIAPLNPAKRSCYFPSMNKDGVYWGQHVGAASVMMAKSGITGQNPVIIDDAYIHYIETLGSKYYFFDLYIKFYSCCRWVHSPIRAISDMMQSHSITAEQIQAVDVFSFGYAGTLYKEAPHCEDEAQYNIKYPIASQILFGNCGPIESSTDKMLDSRVPEMIKRIDFHYDPEYDSYFPAKRISRVELTLLDGTKLNSGPYEPKGDCNADITIGEIAEKVMQINKLYTPESMIATLTEQILMSKPETPFRLISEAIKQIAQNNEHPEYRFI